TSLAVNAITADGLIVLDQRTVFCRQRAVGPDAAPLAIIAGSVFYLRGGSPYGPPPRASLGNVVVDSHAGQDESALVKDGAPIGGVSRAILQAVLERQVLERQRGAAGHVEQAEIRRPRGSAALDDVAIADYGQGIRLPRVSARD